MKPRDVSTVAHRFKQTFCEGVLNPLGKHVRFCHRVREITPYRLARGLLEVFASLRVERIADAHRAFHAWCDTAVPYQPFHQQLAKRTLPVCMRSLCDHWMTRLTREVLRCSAGSPCARFTPMTIHDGTAFAVQSSLKKTFPGRLTTISPAAVELHVSMELLREGMDSVTRTPGSASDVHHVPAAQTLSGGLLLGDRAFFIKEYLREIAACGGSFIVTAKGTLNPTVRQAYTTDGREIKRFRNQALKTVKPKVSRSPALDLEVVWAGELEARLIVTWNAQEKRPRYLLTNLPRPEFAPEQIGDAYRLRWPVERLFKEWKRYANLHAFDTAKPNIAEGLLWAALCASLRKRYCAHMAQRFWQAPISTRKVALCLHHGLAEIFRARLHGQRQFNRTLQRALQYLSHNAQRAHPKRDRKSGRLKLGLEHVYATP